MVLTGDGAECGDPGGRRGDEGEAECGDPKDRGRGGGWGEAERGDPPVTGGAGMGARRSAAGDGARRSARRPRRARRDSGERGDPGGTPASAATPAASPALFCGRRPPEQERVLERVLEEGFCTRKVGRGKTGIAHRYSVIFAIGNVVVLFWRSPTKTVPCVQKSPEIQITEKAITSVEMEIAVGALSGMVNDLPGKLGELLQEECNLLSGVRRDVVFLQSELGTMNAALICCDSIENPDRQTRTWVGQVRDIAYDIEDWIDLFAHRVDGGRQNADDTSGVIQWFRRGFDKLKTLPARHVVATELQQLKARVSELSEQRKRYRFDPPVGYAGGRSGSGIDPRLTALYADSSRLVGLDAPAGPFLAFLGP
ncbi:hypothetical protein GUJ93_ZPchr0001g29279 [Zizania palustris]|uniref:Disease resistance N-terminal domain-containing protein n=1 Tax=Zizania palustris TaxID=103762 RepID=A0A8J5UZU6_ZIZPA|nr:hypothetical protein GUJ93_ZPchr0001g29279 [Zizania palustris]